MNQENVLRVLAGGAKLAKQTSENLKIRTGDFIKEHILHDEFVTRAEYEQLRKLVLKLAEEVRDGKISDNLE